MKTLIKNGTIYTAADKLVGDLLIDGEQVAMLGTKLDVTADKVIDATGRYVIPGGIDVHTHLDLPFGGGVSSDDFETGTVAAAFGGTTCLVDFACQDKGGTLRGGLETWMKKAEGKACIDYGFHLIMREYSDALGKEMGEMVKEGVTSFKVFTAYPGVFMLDDGSIFKAMQRAAELNATIMMHAENGWVIDALIAQAKARGDLSPRWHALTRPPRAEAEATHRAMALAEMANAKVYIVHLTAAEALDEVVRARQRGVKAYAETCPQYLLLNQSNYDEPDFGGAKYVMSPPLRTAERQEELWRGLRDNAIQVVATDHCPFPMAMKRWGEHDFSKIPNGLPAIETRMSLLYDAGVTTGRMCMHRFVQVTSTAPAKLFGLYPRKGTLMPGADADVVVFNPNAEQTISVKTHHMNVDYNPYEGRKVKGVSEVVLSRGQVVVEHGQFKGRKGAGKFLKREAVA